MVDRDSLMRKCRSCGAAIFWAVMSSTGKRNPVDAEPAVDGNLFLFLHSDGAGEEHRLESVHAASATDKAREARGRGQDRYVSHFATCPQASEHRRR